MVDLSMRLSDNFILKEFLHSDAVERDFELKKKQENPHIEIIDNIRYLVETTLQPIRKRINFPIFINSGYRCLEVNRRVGSKDTSQHCIGEAADCVLDPNFLADPATIAVRNEISVKAGEIAGKSFRADLGLNFYLFAFICLNIEKLDIDQVIHEYGWGKGDPKWIHMSSSRRQSKRQIIAVGSYTNGEYIKLSIKEALSYGT